MKNLQLRRAVYALELWSGGLIEILQPSALGASLGRARGVTVLLVRQQEGCVASKRDFICGIGIQQHRFELIAQDFKLEYSHEALTGIRE